VIDDLPGLRFHLASAKVTMRSDSTVHVNGRATRESLLRSDPPGPADLVTLGTRTLFVISRGGRLAIRARDSESRFLRDFTGLRWYPVRDHHRVRAKWLAYREPVVRRISSIVNVAEEMKAPGVAEFEWEGRACRLEPVLSQARLFFIFKDRTAGKTTYPAGRFLDAEPARDGHVWLDFNQAYNPPCAFTPYATCPLPPRRNHLPVAVEAGELDYHSPA
jgi:hypothetical protein